MKNIQFNQTRFDLNKYGFNTSKDFNCLISSIKSKNNILSHLEKNITETFGHIYLVNQYVFKKIEKLNLLLHEGFINQENEYFESDFTILGTMLDICVFKIKSPSEFRDPLCLSIEELELKLAVQLQKLINFSNSAPSNYANNYITEIKIIPGIKLDVYQLIFFGMKHTRHHLNQIKTFLRIDNILDHEEVLDIDVLNRIE
tara:strand:+ start:1476 stop:2078 length:603 start_codon:yes stop_codon:yes gene_type:complete